MEKNIKNLERKVSAMNNSGKIIVVVKELLPYAGKTISFDIVNIKEVS